MKRRRRHRIPRLVRFLLLLAGAGLGWFAAGWMQQQSTAAHPDTPRLAPELLHNLDATTQPNAKTIQTLPASRGGQDLVGKPMPDLHFTRWLNTPDHQPETSHGKITLYRWWTEDCPYCQATLPAIDALRQKYAADGLQVIAVYHPKPRGPVKDSQVLKAAAERHYAGAIAIDEDWSALERAWLTTGDRNATSVSFLVDPSGAIRFVHPGVAYFPSPDPKKQQENADFRLIDSAISQLTSGRR